MHLLCFVSDSLEKAWGKHVCSRTGLDVKLHYGVTNMVSVGDQNCVAVGDQCPTSL
eukprot:NODE_781_length_700_cov_2.330261_g711_i0.p3 GENE.NODE_781_length_700_cov_2.330261_g711_i0~~NODE_781_length_700_cov_2.330261_g711_i0.p3  ORF type:complete len:56 (+),score=8.00 NODE_781_length_700_cov_2.330261_g711_i0:503-670(+)